MKNIFIVWDFEKNGIEKHREKNAVVKEYNDVCRCFTPEQIEAMREIQ